MNLFSNNVCTLGGCIKKHTMRTLSSYKETGEPVNVKTIHRSPLYALRYSHLRAQAGTGSELLPALLKHLRSGNELIF